jgi:hypothetical protein
MNRSESFGVVTVFFLPFQAFGDAAEVFDGARFAETDGSFKDVDIQFLARLELEFFPYTFGNDHLKFGRNFDCIHRFHPEKYIDAD